MIVWLNGPDTAGRTGVVRELLSRWPGALLFDPDRIGELCQRHLLPAPVADVCQLPVWRELVVTAADGLLQTYGRPLIMPLTLLDRAVATGVYRALDALSWPVLQVVVDLPQAEAGWLADEATFLTATGRDPGEVAETILALAQG
ncbi:MAG: hypothetical protein HY241_15775 [Actinobacteria bacterium]|nr:hypothetical protein [Actinomycetota bacterium]